MRIRKSTQLAVATVTASMFVVVVLFGLASSFFAVPVRPGLPAKFVVRSNIHCSDWPWRGLCGFVRVGWSFLVLKVGDS